MHCLYYYLVHPVPIAFWTTVIYLELVILKSLLPSESDILDHIKVPGREYQTFFVYHYEKFDNSDKIDYYDYSYLQACYKQESYPITCTYSPK